MLDRRFAAGLPALALLAALLPREGEAQALASLPAAVYPCQVFPSEHTELASQVVGVLAEVMVDRGMQVRRGQPVARLHAEVEETQVALALAKSQAEAALRSRRAKLGLAERTLQRNRDLVNQRAISENEADQIRTDREVAAQDVATAVEALGIARHELAQARAELEVRTIRSPIDGVVTQRSLSAGEQVRDKPIMTIERLDRLHVELSLPEVLLGRVRVGDKAVLHFDVPGLAPVEVAASLVDRSVDPGSHTFGVRFVLENADLAVPSGIRCRADLQGLR